MEMKNSTLSAPFAPKSVGVILISNFDFASSNFSSSSSIKVESKTAQLFRLAVMFDESFFNFDKIISIFSSISSTARVECSIEESSVESLS